MVENFNTWRKSQWFLEAMSEGALPALGRWKQRLCRWRLDKYWYILSKDIFHLPVFEVQNLIFKIFLYECVCVRSAHGDHRLMLDVFFSLSLPCVLKWSLSLHLEFIDLARLVCLCLLNARTIGTHYSVWFFTWALEIWTYVLIRAWQAPYLLSRLQPLDPFQHLHPSMTPSL